MSSGFEIISVSQLNYYVKSQLESDPLLCNVFLRGEISNFTNHYRSGHLYLSLKDDNSVIKAVMFKNSAKFLKFLPCDGMKVIAFGRASLYDRDGQYQFYIQDLQPDGQGALNLAFEQLKKKLNQEGLFEEQHKKSLPNYPVNIGVVTSPTGAVIEDIRNVLSRRWPLAKIILQPSKVQGEDAPKEICDAISTLDNAKQCDVIILARGGGSLEDLFCFNNEEVARAIYNCETPIISAVGHETDYTIADYVADLRAPTPSAAAELAVKDINEVKKSVKDLNQRLINLYKSKLYIEEQHLDNLTNKSFFLNKENIFNPYKLDLEKTKILLDNKYNKILSRYDKIFSENITKLEALSPLKVLSRGYTITQKEKLIIESVKDIRKDDVLSLTFKDGIANCKVFKTSERDLIKNEN